MVTLDPSVLAPVPVENNENLVDENLASQQQQQQHWSGNPFMAKSATSISSSDEPFDLDAEKVRAQLALQSKSTVLLFCFGSITVSLTLLLYK